jgi:hypothetical protein
MESNLEENRIRCSQAAAELLQTQWPELPLKPRGMIPIKGKGEMFTFWVNETAETSFVVTDEDDMLDWVSGPTRKKSFIIGGHGQERRQSGIEEAHPDSQPQIAERVDILFGDQDDEENGTLSSEFRMIENLVGDQNRSR